MSTPATLTVTMFLTLDGVAQAPGAPDEDREGGFEHGGWLVPYFDDDMMAIVNDLVGRATGLLLGRKTYQIFVRHWPHVTDPEDKVATVFNRIPKYVVSRTLDRADWKGTTVLRGDIATEIAELKRRHAGNIQVHGSPRLARSLFAADLVDECHLWTYPVVVGGGKRLFEDGGLPTAFALLGTRTTGAGVVVGSYRRVGRPTYGAFGLETVGQEVHNRPGSARA